MKEAEVEREFRGMREDLDKFSLGCYFGEVTQALALEGLPGADLCSLILKQPPRPGPVGPPSGPGEGSL